MKKATGSCRLCGIYACGFGKTDEEARADAKRDHAKRRKHAHNFEGNFTNTEVLDAEVSYDHMAVRGAL